MPPTQDHVQSASSLSPQKQSQKLQPTSEQEMNVMRAALLPTMNQTFGCFDHRSPIYQKIITTKNNPYQSYTTPQKSRRTSIHNSAKAVKSAAKICKYDVDVMISLVPPDVERVLSEYTVIEKGFRDTQYKLNPNYVINGAKEITPKLVRE